MSRRTTGPPAAGPDPVISTGLPGLDRVIDSLRPGDNVVWRVDDISDYRPFATAVVARARAANRPACYLRFATHEALFPPGQPAVKTRQLDPRPGFENFLTAIHRLVEANGPGGFYVFDSLSALSQNCFSDRMIGNFFKVTCPFLRRMETIAYFAIYRHYHSWHAARPIAETTQVLIDVYRHRDDCYVKPLKVQGRHSPAMYMLHRQHDDDFRPVTESAVISAVLSSSPWPGLPSASYRMIGIWDRMLMKADDTLEEVRRGESPPEKEKRIFDQIAPLLFSHDRQILDLVGRYLNLADLVYIWKRMIGTGMIGGKSAGMLIARAVLAREMPGWREIAEDHDSFFIGSDVFYTFLVENGCWEDKQRQKDPRTFLTGLEAARQRILKGNFPDYIMTRFTDMLDYFGQSPIIVRSSSLLEDNFGNAFAGKYDSVFCANQGTPERRLANFLRAVKIVYASTMSKEALNYRRQWHVLDRDEQMALLVQRVSGNAAGHHFFPHLAGVGFSFNSYAWNKEIDPESGLARLVFGLGTRAVDRNEDDYTRVVALNAPERRPETNFDEVRRRAQRRVDILDLEADRFRSDYFSDLAETLTGLPLDLFATRDHHGEGGAPAWLLTFDNLFRETDLIPTLRRMLAVLRRAYLYHVDIEFTVNFPSPGRFHVNLLQCRPLQVRETGTATMSRPRPDDRDIILRANGAVIGHNRFMPVDRLVYIVPAAYGRLEERRRRETARLIGEINRVQEKEGGVLALLGPGRWGTSTPALGVPVSFSQIYMTSVLCEIDTMHAGLVPDLSLGTHFFNELVEMNLLYLAYFTRKKGNIFREDLLLETPNRLAAVLPGTDPSWNAVIHVVESGRLAGGRALQLFADSREQAAIIYRR